jgi:hypothetical protein
MSYECIYCNFTAPTNTRLKRHLSTQKHSRILASLQKEESSVQEETKQIVDKLIENVEELKNEILDKKEGVKLCKNVDCERYPPDWNFEEDTEDSYEEGQWRKCSLCPGYFNDDGLGDILFIEEEPNNKEAGCDLCGKTQNIVQMKGNGQYICGNACDEDASEDESDAEEPVKLCVNVDRERDPLDCNDEEESVQEEEIISKEVVFVDEEDEDLLLMPSNDDVQDIDKDGFECDDCSKTGRNCFENLGLTKRAADIYMDLGEPDRCEDCYDKWIGSEDGEEYLNEINKELEPSNGRLLESVNEDSEIDVPIEFFFLDIEYINMVNDFNNFLTTHPFTLQMIGFFMNILKWFGIPQGGEAPL